MVRESRGGPHPPIPARAAPFCVGSSGWRPYPRSCHTTISPPRGRRPRGAHPRAEGPEPGGVAEGGALRDGYPYRRPGLHRRPGLCGRPSPPDDERSRASLTLSAHPFSALPFTCATAFCASVSELISTKPKPREWPVTRSVTTVADTHGPTCENNAIQVRSHGIGGEIPDVQPLAHGVLPEATVRLFPSAEH